MCACTLASTLAPGREPRHLGLHVRQLLFESRGALRLLLGVLLSHLDCLLELPLLLLNICGRAVEVLVPARMLRHGRAGLLR